MKHATCMLHRFAVSGSAALLLLAGWLSMALADPPPAGEGRIVETDGAGILYSTSVTLAASTTYRFYTSHLSGGADPVLHVIGDQGDGSYAHEGSSDDHGTGNCSTVPDPSNMGSFDACFEYTSPGGGPQDVTIFVHAYSKARAGTCRLTVKALGGSSLHSSSIAFAGDSVQEVDTYDVVWSSGERLDYAYSLTGMLYPRMLVLRGSEDLVGWSTKNVNGQTYNGLLGSAPDPPGELFQLAEPQRERRTCVRAGQFVQLQGDRRRERRALPERHRR